MTHKSKRERRYAADYKFERLAALNVLEGQGGSAAIAARKTKKKLTETWTKRHGGRAGELHRPHRATGTDAGVALPQMPKAKGPAVAVRKGAA